MSSSVAEITSNANKPKGGSDNLEKEAVGLEVAVRIHGSEVSLVALDAPEHAEPFEEDTSTMIVFPRGAVVKLRARVRSGHAVVLTNLQTKQTALCKIIQVNSAANASNYVKLEFSQPMPGFWGVQFPSDARAEAPSAESKVSLDKKPERQSPFSATSTFDLQEETPGRVASPHAIEAELPKSLAPASPSAKPIETFSVPEADSTSYGASDNTQRDLMPLAAAPPKKAPNATVPATIRPAKPAPRAAAPTPPKPENPIFDSLSTDEDVFGSEKTSKPAVEAVKTNSEKRVFQAALHSLESSALSSEPHKKRSGLLVFGGIAAAIVISAGGWYVMKHRAAPVQSVSATAPAAAPVSTSPATSDSATASATPAPAQTNPASSTDAQAPTDSANPSISADPSASRETGLDSTITVTPIHEGSPAAPEENSASSASPSSAGNIYSGNLTARPKASKRKNIHVAAPLPKINASVPDSIAGSSDNSGLSSLVGGVSAGLPAPPTVPAANGGKIVPPRLIHSVPITYPAIANTNHVEGDVEVQTTIAPTGKVESAKAISGPVLLREAAVSAVRQWRYSPATLDGKPVSIQYTVTVRFHLND